MAKRNRKALYCVTLCALALVASVGETTASGLPASLPARDECTDWEDWDNLRFWGLWTDEYHVASSPDYNPDQESKWWKPRRIVFATGKRHYHAEPGYTLDDHHEACGGWL